MQNIVLFLMASLSTGSKRPLPQIIENKGSPIHFSDEGGSDSGGRRHMSFSVPRTRFAPSAEEEALKRLKQRMTFSDESVRFFPHE